MNAKKILTGIGTIVFSTPFVHAHSAHDTLPPTWSMMDVLHHADEMTGWPITLIFVAGVALTLVGIYTRFLRARPKN